MNVWMPISEPCARIWRTRSGSRATDDPTTKNVPGTWYFASTARICGVHVGSGPSSKVNATVARRQGDALPSAVGQVDHRAARAHRGGHRGVVAVLARSPCVDPDLRADQPVQQQHAAEHGDDQSDQQELRAYSTTVAGGGGGVVVPHQPERHRDAPPVRADEDVRSVASEAPVRAFDDDVTTFGAVVTAVLGAIFGAHLRRGLGRRGAARGGGLGGACPVRCGRGHGRGLRGHRHLERSLREARGVRPEHHRAGRDAGQIGQRPDRCAGEADADHAEVGQAGQRDQPAEAGDELAAPPRCVHEDGHDRCRDDRRGDDSVGHIAGHIVGGISPHGSRQ